MTGFHWPRIDWMKMAMCADSFYTCRNVTMNRLGQYLEVVTANDNECDNGNMLGNYQTPVPQHSNPPAPTHTPPIPPLSSSPPEREKVYVEYQKKMKEACSHHHSRSSRKSAKTSKAKKRSRSSEKDSPSASSEINSPEAPPQQELELPAVKKKKSKKAKHKRRNSRSLTPPLVQDGGTPPPESRGASEQRDSDSGGAVERKKSVRSGTPDSLPEKGDLSETELEKQRALLLAQLKEPEYED